MNSRLNESILYFMGGYQYLKENFLEQYFGKNIAAQSNFLKLFKVSSSETFEKLTSAITIQDASNASVYAHNLCSALKYLGVYELSVHFLTIERDLDSGNFDWKNIQENFETAARHYAAVILDVDMMINKISSE